MPSWQEQVPGLRFGAATELYVMCPLVSAGMQRLANVSTAIEGDEIVLDENTVLKRIDAALAKAKDVIEKKLAPTPGGYRHTDTAAYSEWESDTLALLTEVSKYNGSFMELFKRATQNRANLEYSARQGIGILRSLKQSIQENYFETATSQADIESVLPQILNRFHNIARALRDRRENRPTIELNDEYDVQDLLHGLLLLYFDDIRKEERTPSYAGSSSTMDFLLKNEKTVVETKKTRAGLGTKEVGNQLIEDIAHYKAHQDCKILYCFVYDPEGRVGNPRGLENDLSGDKDGLRVSVLIRP